MTDEAAQIEGPSGLDKWLDAFPLGKTPLVMAVLFVCSALVVGFGGGEEKKTLSYWCFARTHYDDYIVAKERFEAQYPGWTVDIKLVDHPSLLNRLTAAFVRGSGAPDACEVEITGIGRFFKGEAEDVPFADLKALGAQFGDAGWERQIVASRYAPWSYKGRIFGMPQDLHPVIFLYRQDLFAAAGYPDLPSSAKTWDDFVRIAREVSRPKAQFPQDPRYAIGLHNKEAWQYWQLLHQQGVSVYDEGRRSVIDSPESVAALSLIAQMFREGLAYPIRDLPTFWAAVKRDEVLTFLAADWFVGFLRNNVPEQAGKWRAMPIPAWREGGRRVSTHGGTTTVIPKQGKNKQMAWEFTKFLYLSKNETVERALKTRVMPAMHAAYKDARLLEDRFSYLGDQRLGLLFAELKDDIPPVYLHSSWTEASVQMNNAVFQVVEGGGDPAAELGKLRAHIDGIMQRYADIEAILQGEG